MDKNPKVRICVSFGIILLLMVTCFIPMTAGNTQKSQMEPQGGEWLYVGGNGPGNYTAIQNAIDEATPGDTVFVYSGTYLENIFINNTVRLIGEDKNTTIIDSNAHNDTIYIGFPADNVTITGFTIQNSGNYSLGGGIFDVGIEIHSDYNFIQDNIISNHPRYGILLWGSKGNTISYNLITACNLSGLYFFAGPNNIISHNMVCYNYIGISALGSPNAKENLLSSNTFLGNSKGLSMYDSGSQILCNNFIENRDFNAMSHFNFITRKASRNIWRNNFWDDWLGFGPKWVPGFLGFNFDWSPVKEPYSYHEIQPVQSQRPGDGNVTKWAVLIACSGGLTYERHERRDRNDVRVLTHLLEKNGWDDSHILVLMEEEATVNAILYDSFQWLTDNGEDADDIILYFYSGHGYYHTMDQLPIDEPDGRDEVINPWDPDMAGWNPDVFIVDDVLAEKFNGLQSENIVIIIHTCHAGGWIDGDSDLTQSGRVVLVSSGVDEASGMMFFPIHWLFPYYLIVGLKGWADENNDKVITAEELFRYTVNPVQFRSGLNNRIFTGKWTVQTPLLSDEWPNTQDNAEELKLIDVS
jgi:parallel beta-helix repeat protein